MRFFYFYTFLIVLLISCNTEDSNKSISNTTENEEFVYFWDNFKFNKEFQRTRIIFPLKYLYIEYNDTSCKDDTIVNYIEKSDFNNYDFISENLHFEFSAYGDNITSVLLTLPETGINIEFFFERINNTWFLKEVLDSGN